MGETSFEVQCLRLISTPPKPATDSDEEGESTLIPCDSELISRYYALRQCPHPRLVSLIKLTALRRDRYALVVENYPRTLADIIQERR